LLLLVGTIVRLLRSLCTKKKHKKTKSLTYRWECAVIANAAVKHTANALLLTLMCGIWLVHGTVLHRDYSFVVKGVL
jgi:hypothetical protein